MIAPFRTTRRAVPVVLSVALALAAPAPSAFLGAQAASTIPARLSDAEFRRINTEFSEPGGYFRSDNFLSNETGFQYVIPTLLRLGTPGGVYLGVGPEQNFTYITALRPRIAIIFDIRRGNMMEHLMYKALFELSADRADFLSRLFSRSRPPGLDTASTPGELFDAYVPVAPDTALFRKNLAAIRERLVKGHGLALSDSDSRSLEYVYTAFFGGGPFINYNYPYGGRGFGRGSMPTYATLQTATDSAGHNWAFLATEANYRWIKDFETRNLVVPVVGDFAGPKAIRAVARYLTDHHAVVTAFYTSNVEQYLFQGVDDWSRYYQNVATLPIDSTSSFIRSIGGGFRGSRLPARFAGQRRSFGMRLPSVTSSMQELLKAFNEGRIQSYRDVIELSR